MTTIPHLPTTTVLLPLLLATASLAIGCGGSSDTGGPDDSGSSSGVDLSGDDAFDVTSAIGWTRNAGSVPAQILMVFGGWEMNCQVFTTWSPEERHFPVLGDGGFVYAQLYANEDPYTGAYEKIEGDPTCYDEETFETICPRMISFAQWGTISEWDGDGTEADFVEDGHDATTSDVEEHVVTLDSFSSDRFAGSFAFAGKISGTFSVPNCGDGKY